MEKRGNSATAKCTKKERNKAMNSLVMTREQITKRVQSSNSFTREELTANRDMIKTLRAEKKAALAKVTGGFVAVIVDQKIAEGFILTDVKQKDGMRQDTVEIVMKRSNTMSDLDRAKAERAKLDEKIARMEATAA